MSNDFQTIREALRPSVGRGKHLVVIASPKSGSTALANMLVDATGWPLGHYSDHSIDNYTFSPVMARWIRDQDTVIHLHCLPHIALLAWLRETGYVPIVLSRDIADSIVSQRDHSRRTTSWFDRDVAQSSDDNALRLVFYRWAFWYARFHREWDDVTTKGFDLIRLDYADLFADPAATIREMFARNGLDEPNAETVERVIGQVKSDRTRSNLNVGLTGRGAKLPADLQSALRLMCNPLDPEWRG